MKTCCGCLLEDLAKIIAIVDIIVSTITFIFFVAAIVIEGTLDGKFIALLVVVILVFLLEFYLYVTLKSAAIEKNHTKCKRWLIIRISLLVLHIAGIIYSLAVKRFDKVDIITCIRTCWHIFEIIAIKRFMDEINGVGDPGQEAEAA